MADKVILRCVVSEKLQKTVKKIIKGYPDQFDFIKPEDVIVVRNTWAEKSAHIADIRLVPPVLEPLLGTKIILQVYMCHWRNLSPEARLIVLMHELMHIVQNERDTGYTKPYAMQTHDVQEFGSLIAKYGLHWQRSEKLPNILEEKVKISRPMDKMPVMG